MGTTCGVLGDRLSISSGQRKARPLARGSTICRERGAAVKTIVRNVGTHLFGRHEEGPRDAIRKRSHQGRDKIKTWRYSSFRREKAVLRAHFCGDAARNTDVEWPVTSHCSRLCKRANTLSRLYQSNPKPEQTSKLCTRIRAVSGRARTAMNQMQPITRQIFLKRILSVWPASRWKRHRRQGVPSFWRPY